MRWLLCVFSVFCAATVRAQCPEPAVPVTMAVIDMERANHLGGLAASERHPGLLWAHNDHEDPAVLGFDSEGKWTVVVRPTTTEPMNLTDIAVRDGYVYVLDVVASDEVRVHRFEEPRRLPAGAPVRSPSWGADLPSPPEVGVRLQTLRANYAGRFTRAEALMVGEGGEVFVFSHGETTSLYGLGRFPTRPSRERQTAELLAELDLPMVTGADLSADGRSLVVRSHRRARLYRGAEGATVVTLLASAHCAASLGAERDGGAIAFSHDARSYFTVGIGRTALHQYTLTPRAP